MKICVLLCLLLELASASSHVFERKSASLETEWHRHSRPSPDHRLNLQIALASEDHEIIERHALDIANPNGRRWRKHLSPLEIADMLRPKNETVDAVMKWLRSVGITGEHSNDMIFAGATVKQAEKLLNTSYSVYIHHTGKRAIRTEEYSMPVYLHGHVDFVSPTVHFPNGVRANIGYPLLRKHTDGRNPVRHTSLLDAAKSNQTYYNSSLVGPCGNGDYPNLTITPECIRAAYSLDWTTSSPNTSFAVFDVDEGKFNNSNLQAYLERYRPEAALAGATFDLVDAPGVNESFIFGSDSEEIDMDTQLTMGLAWPAKASLIQANIIGIYGNYTSGFSAGAEKIGQDEFLQWLHELTYNETVSPVVTFSAGSCEENVPYSYAQRACRMMAAAGARGVTFLFSSGDDGPSEVAYHKLTLSPQWPAGCPWVTAVGATANPFNETAATSHTAGLTSAGGFSIYFSRPSWQDEAVTSYISKYVDPYFQNYSGFNAYGRGFPDISAFGYDVPTIGGPSGLHSGGGTSAASPIIAAIITLLNDYESSRGNPTLGFINPWLYSLKNGELRDITTGNGSDYLDSFSQSSPSALQLPHPPVGYNGSVGWDALTGLGVPVFSKMRAALP